MATPTLHSSVTTSVLTNATAIDEYTADASNVTTFTTDLSSPGTWEETTLINYENLTSTLNIMSDTFAFPMRNGAIGLGVFAGFVLIVIIVASIANRFCKAPCALFEPRSNIYTDLNLAEIASDNAYYN